jgi:hypothetical protein
MNAAKQSPFDTAALKIDGAYDICLEVVSKSYLRPKACVASLR